MTKEEMIDNLGTIAKSGTQNFLKSVEESKEKEKSESLIGQFGVGFYASFMVGEKIDVISRPQGAEKACLWSSDGSGEFSVADVENCDFNRGTKVIIHLKPECREFAKPGEIQKIITKHSNFISYSIKLNGEVVNNLQAIWYREKKDVTLDEYQRFYEVVANQKLPYKYVIHFKSDLPLEIKALLYLPGTSNEKFGQQEESSGLSLYSRKVLIKPKCQELLPGYLRMVKGVVDCSDIPLSISRETYQDSSLIFKLKTVITKRVLKRLEDESATDPENYDKFYEEFHQNLKEGIMSDHENSDLLLRLQRFKANFSNNSKIGIEDYIKKMVKDQEKIYFLINTDPDHPQNSVFLEKFKKTELPVLISSNPFDEVIFKQIGQYKSKINLYN
jgi:HSP90 family molecular chaperone